MGSFVLYIFQERIQMQPLGARPDSCDPHLSHLSTHHNTRSPPGRAWFLEAVATVRQIGYTSRMSVALWRWKGAVSCVRRTSIDEFLTGAGIDKRVFLGRVITI